MSHMVDKKMRGLSNSSLHWFFFVSSMKCNLSDDNEDDDMEDKYINKIASQRMYVLWQMKFFFTLCCRRRLIKTPVNKINWLAFDDEIRDLENVVSSVTPISM